MPDPPEHLPVPINANGDGPCPAEEAVAIVCWCGETDCLELGDLH
jgi:hypothetical protein